MAFLVVLSEKPDRLEFVVSVCVGGSTPAFLISSLYLQQIKLGPHFMQVCLLQHNKIFSRT